MACGNSFSSSKISGHITHESLKRVTTFLCPALRVLRKMVSTEQREQKQKVSEFFINKCSRKERLWAVAFRPRGHLGIEQLSWLGHLCVWPH